MYGLNIPLDVKIKCWRDSDALAVGCFRWGIYEGAHDERLGSCLDLKQLALILVERPLLIFRHDNYTHDLEIIDSNDSTAFFHANKELIYNPNKVDMDWYFSLPVAQWETGVIESIKPFGN